MKWRNNYGNKRKSSFNLNIVECKSLNTRYNLNIATGFNLNIVECKCKYSKNSKIK